MTTLDTNISKAVTAHGEDTYPHECCGFLYGSDTQEGRHVTGYLAVENKRTDNRERRFSVSPEDYLRAEQYADENDTQLIGIYHSHPDHPALPSEHDRVQAMPFFSYFIVSVMQGKGVQLRSWLLNSEFQFEEELLSENKRTK